YPEIVFDKESGILTVEPGLTQGKYRATLMARNDYGGYGIEIEIKVYDDNCTHNGGTHLNDQGFPVCDLCERVVFSAKGSGTEADPYQIKDNYTWTLLRAAILDGFPTEGLNFLQTADFEIGKDEDIGWGSNHFRGNYDGGGHTITINVKNGPSYSTIFRDIENITIKNLNTVGTINTASNSKYAAGVASVVWGNCTFNNVHSSVTIESGKSGDGTHGGFTAICKDGSNTLYEDCVFDGKLLNPETTLSGGFVGYAVNNTVSFKNCLMAASEFEFTNSRNFIRNGNNVAINMENCYHIAATADHAEQGIKGYAIKGDDVKVSLSGAPGLEYNDAAYAGADETAYLKLSYKGELPSGSKLEYTASSGTLAQNEDLWMLTMPAEDVTISTNITKKITPKLSLSTKTYVYNGKVKNPTLTVKDGTTKLVKGTDYKVTVPKGRKNPGKYTYKVTLMGKYIGSGSISFKINPKGTTLKSVTAGSKALTVKWNKQSTQTTGYQIQLATNSSFTKGKKLITVSKNTTVSKKVTGLKAKKTYYVRIRTYKTVSGTKHYSKWSKAISAKTKA
ncbi:MAG: fibronectin type III domain-containing protein, partial [Clostridiales bacterium]|nr:fibronectin type III domain-containing protein [Clostridiales bacterium]